jgi:hypothetical protein
LLSVAHLTALRDALATDNPRLIQGAVVRPLYILRCLGDAPYGACAIGYCGWIGDNLPTVNDVADFFFNLTRKCDARPFYDWFDKTPRDVMRASLLPEVERALASR